MKIRYSPAVLAALGRSDEARRLIEQEQATVRLAAATAPVGHHAAFAEVLRRVELGMTLQAATESVTDDVVAGRWQPVATEPPARDEEGDRG